ncbi:permease prefix domain 1-containing protein [Nocardiopsis alba]|uniref:permease prefix domain 1-containing protein n=1 Tax=Nocardiopsis alba TaxID=53437 RepID=UPI0033D8372C
MDDRKTETTLTDRYVWTVTRHLGAEAGPDVARELRASIRDRVEAGIEAGNDPATAEREALTELGDPETLAREYGELPRHLIGPALYPDYVRLLRALLAILAPLALALLFVDRFESGAGGLGEIGIEAAVVLVTVTVHVAFWTTLVFAIIERARPADRRDLPLTAWGPDRLDVDVPGGRVGLPGTVARVALEVAMIALLVWQFSGVSDLGSQIQVLDPGLGLAWKVLLIGALAAGAVTALAAWRVGRWTSGLSVIDVLVTATGALVTVYLLIQDRLIVSDLSERLSEVFGGTIDLTISNDLLAALVIVIAVWDIADRLRGHRRDTTKV